MLDLNNVPVLDNDGKLAAEQPPAQVAEIATPAVFPPAQPAQPSLQDRLAEFKPHTTDGQRVRLQAIATAFAAGLPATDLLAGLTGRPLLTNESIRLEFLQAVRACKTVEQLESLDNLQHHWPVEKNLDMMQKAIVLGSTSIAARHITTHQSGMYLTPSDAFLELLGKQTQQVQANWVKNFTPSTEVPLIALLGKLKKHLDLPFKAAAEAATSYLTMSAPATTDEWCALTVSTHKLMVRWLRGVEPWERPGMDHTGLGTLKAFSALARNQFNKVDAVLAARHTYSSAETFVHRRAMMTDFFKKGPPENLMKLLDCDVSTGNDRDTAPAHAGIVDITKISDEMVASATPKATLNLARLGDSRVANSAALNRVIWRAEAYAVEQVLTIFSKFNQPFVLEWLPKTGQGWSNLAGIAELMLDPNFQLARHHDVVSLLNNVVPSANRSSSVDMKEKDELLIKLVNKLVTADVLREGAEQGTSLLHTGIPAVFKALSEKLPPEQFDAMLQSKDVFGRTPGFYLVNGAYDKLPEPMRKKIDFSATDNTGLPMWQANSHVRREAFNQMAMRGEYLKTSVEGRSADSKSIFFKVMSENGKDLSKKAASKSHGYVRYSEAKQMCEFRVQQATVSLGGTVTPVPVAEQFEKAVKQVVSAVLDEYNNRGHLESLRAPAKKKDLSR